MEELKIEKISEYKWMIPKIEDMRVPGIIFISEKLLKKAIEDKAVVQVANVAKLPGIVKYSLAMPDVHWGYGAPIGGVGGFNSETGVIIPGFVGYDINCLTEDAVILSSLGYSFKIKDWSEKIGDLICFNKKNPEKEKAEVGLFIKKRVNEEIYIIKTKSGYEIKLTGDHPIWTLNGKILAKDIEKGEKIIIFPFKGVPYEEPEDEVILSEEEFAEYIQKNFNKTLKGNALGQIINSLKKNQLLPLKYTSSCLPYILKLMGYLFGDGNISYNKNNGDLCTYFFGDFNDLKEIQQDIKKIGYSAYLYNRKRKHKITTAYATYEFESTTATCQTASRSFSLLMAALGVPVGNKTSQDFNIPVWLWKAPLWQKRLFLASFFGAEMSSPVVFGKGGYNFYLPYISMNKCPEYKENGVKFMKELSLLLEEFGVKTNRISIREEKSGKEGKTKLRIRLFLSNKIESLLNLYEKIGFEYNKNKSFLANVAISYLRNKKKILKEREKVAVLSNELKKNGIGPCEIYTLLESDFVNRRFIERSLYERRKTSPRIPYNFEGFHEYKTYIEEFLGRSGFVIDEVLEIRKMPYDGYVYDFTVLHPDHNFVANNILVSNCGVRLIRTNLTVNDVKDKLQNLINMLFINVPCGVGSSGKLRLKRKELEELVVEGARWAIKHGFGKKEDLENIEEYGCMEGADPSVISNRAYERGLEQSGTLGSGNHFLEIQQVIHIYDEEIAKVFGLFNGQITIMVHTGSRGFGHQICDDYLDMFGKVVHKYGIKLPDKQLACAPCNSPEGQRYFKAMKAAANYAFANRQMIYYWIAETFSQIFKKSPEALGIETVYDVAHNICKFETHIVNGNQKRLYIHRKGATRAFPAGHPEVPEKYRKVGQPVIIPGTMGTASYVLVGTEKAMEETWGSTCHGAGRMMSRSQAIKEAKGRSISKELAEKGVLAKAISEKGLAEEMPAAYKDVDEVIKVVEGAGISKKVAKMIPIGVIKG